jgi:hypothetical protein
VSEHKACVQCGKSYPATTKHFHKSKDGLHARCKKCRNKHERRSRDVKKDRKLKEIERGAVDLFIASSRVGGANIPHSSELLEVMMRYFGGVEGFGRAFMKQFFDSPAGGAFRTKQLDSILRLIVNNTAMGGAKKPLELMTEEELEAEARRQIMEAAMSLKVNGFPVRLEKKDENVRHVQVVDDERGEDGDSVGVPALSAPLDSQRMEVPPVG